jgi:hypothetical protein
MNNIEQTKILQRGQEAARIIESEVFKLAIQTLKDSVTEQWKSCPIRDKEGQLLLLQLAKVTDKFEGVFIGLVEQGKMIQHKIDLDNARDEPQARKFFRKVVGAL